MSPPISNLSCPGSHYEDLEPSDVWVDSNRMAFEHAWSRFNAIDAGASEALFPKLGHRCPKLVLCLAMAGVYIVECTAAIFGDQYHRRAARAWSHSF